MGRDRDTRPPSEGDLKLELLWDEDPELDAQERKLSAPNPCQKATLLLALNGGTGAKKSRDSQQLLAAVEPHRSRSSQSLSAVRQPMRAWSERPRAGSTPAPPGASRTDEHKAASQRQGASEHITSDDPFARPTQPPPPSMNPALSGGAAPADDGSAEIAEISAARAPDLSDVLSPPPSPVEPALFDETSFGDITAELEHEYEAPPVTQRQPFMTDGGTPEAPFASEWKQNDIATEPPPSAGGKGAASGSFFGANAAADGDVVRRAAGRTGISLDEAAFEALEAMEDMEPGALGLVSRRARLSERPSTASLPAVEPATTPSSAPGAPTSRNMQDRFEVGDYSGALELAVRILEEDPDDMSARLMADECTTTLTQMLSARLGSLTQRPTIGLPLDQIRWLSLDHRAGFLLSLMDGQLSIDDVLDVSGMPRLDAMRLLTDLVDQRVIALAPA